MNRLLLSLSLLAVPALGCQGAPAPDPSELVVPADWPLIDSGCGFLLRAPLELVRQEVRGVDSCVGELRSGALRLSYDHGGYSDPLHYEDRPGYREEAVRIGSRDAKVIAFSPTDVSGAYVTAAHFADLGRGVRLTLWTEARDEATAALARRILYSVSFP